MNSAGMKSSTEGRQGWDEFGRDGIVHGGKARLGWIRPGWNRPRKEGKDGMASIGMDSTGMDSTGMRSSEGESAWRAGRRKARRLIV
jgi:hypothetical protein